MPPRIYISDTNIWIDFGHAGLLDDVFSLPFTFVSTDFVLAELSDPASAVLMARGLVIETTEAANFERLYELMAAHGNSSLADISCYLIAKERGHPLLTGDGRLRKQAAKEGVQVHGALWLLDQLVAHDVIAPIHAAAALRTMLDAGARLPHDQCLQRLTAWIA